MEKRIKNALDKTPANLAFYANSLTQTDNVTVTTPDGQPLEVTVSFRISPETVGKLLTLIQEKLEWPR